MINKIKLSIIIVYFGEKKEVNNLLRSIRKSQTESDYEIILVNNKVGDDIGKLLKGQKNIKVVESGGDLGYGKGNNLGAKSAKGKYLLIINPDTKVIPGSIDNLVNFLDKNKNAAIAAPNLLDTKGKLFERQGTRLLTPLRAIFSITILSRIFPGNKYVRDYYMSEIPKSSLREVDFIPGSAFLIRKKVYDQMHGFDKNFFLYFEEFDLCKRVKEVGWKIYMVPDAVVEHDWEPSEKTPDSKYFAESRFYYFRKHYGIIWAIVVEFFARLSKKVAFILLLLLTLVIWSILPSESS